MTGTSKLTCKKDLELPHLCLYTKKRNASLAKKLQMQHARLELGFGPSRGAPTIRIYLLCALNMNQLPV